MKHTALAVTATVGIGLAAITVLQARSASAPPAEARPAPAQEERLVAAEGRVAAYPGAEVKVAAERGGRLLRVLVDEGKAVRQGDLLAEIESDELAAGLEEARARVAEAEAEARLAEATLRRRQHLVAEGILSAHDLDEARRDVETSQARIATGRAESARQAALLARSRVVAPRPGVVTLRTVDAGETVETGQQLFVIADLARLRVEAEADEADAPRLRVGAPATVTAQGWTGQSWEGRVEEIGDAVTPRRLKPQDPSRLTDTRILAVKVAFVEKTPLKLGATVELKIRHH